MQNKKRNEQAMPTTNGRTYRFYLPVNLYETLLGEAGEKDIAISRLLREKLEKLDRIACIIQKEESDG